MTAPLLVVALSGLAQLPAVSDRAPVAFDHFPSRVHAFVWRNWHLVPVERMAAVLDAEPADVMRTGRAMGLGEPPEISADQERRSYITVIRRNWHLLPYPQLVELLDTTAEELAFTLREDDFLYIKLGRMKPECAPLRYTPPNDAVRQREEAIAATLESAFDDGIESDEPLFQFVSDLSAPPDAPDAPIESPISPRFCSSYFALFGDPLIEEDINPYPDGYLERLAASGVDSVWLHAVLYQLAPFPWDESLSRGYQQRLRRLKTLVERADRHGIGIYLYLNEPRAMPLGFYDDREELKGVVEGEHAALCTSVPEVRRYLTAAVESVCRAVPGLRGFFTITASENLTNCWSHHRGDACPRCGERSPAAVVAEVNQAVERGIEQSNTDTELIAWDWGWRDAWAVEAIRQLPEAAALMSVSEWSIPIERGGVENRVGEYSISTIGPGPRATKHWAAAKNRGLKTVAKIQAGNTWELAAVPYIPALRNVTQHALNLREAQIDGIMLGWTLGGYPSPNLQVVAEVLAAEKTPAAREVMTAVAADRYGSEAAPAVVDAWERCSDALSHFPFDGSVVYRAPLQAGPANLLWGEATGYASTMLGLQYDDLEGWRGPYPADVFIDQCRTMAEGFEGAFTALSDAVGPSPSAAIQGELNVIETAAIHYRSVAQQARFVQLRRSLDAAPDDEDREAQIDELETLIRRERKLARRLHAIQQRDSRIGYEASNHYFYVPVDLAEKVINCDYLLAEWIPELRDRLGGANE